MEDKPQKGILVLKFISGHDLPDRDNEAIKKQDPYIMVAKSKAGKPPTKVNKNSE